jgi:hypothetical protein
MPDGLFINGIDASPDAQGMSVDVETLKKLGHGSAGRGRRWLKTWIDKELGATPINGPTDKPDGVRVATEDDEDALLALMMQDVQENALNIASPSPSKILEQIRRGTRRKGNILAVIDGPDGKPVACLNLMFFQWWWSEAHFLQEVWNYVHPAHRASKHAATLMRFARWCSDNMTEKSGYRVWLFMGVTSKAATERKVMFYSQYANPIGAFFIYPHPGGKT